MHTDHYGQGPFSSSSATLIRKIDETVQEEYIQKKNSPNKKHLLDELKQIVSS